MTNTKWLSALLAGTALSVASTAALADTSFLTMKRNIAGEGVTFMVSPTADMPAAATEVTIKGEVRGRALMADADGADSVSDFTTRTRIFVTGKTETSVGTVGVYTRLQSEDGGNVSASKTYGYWQMTPDLQLLVGRTDDIGAIEAGLDWNFDGSLTGDIGGPTNVIRTQARLTYGSGPFTWAVAIQDASPGAAASSDTSNYGFGTAIKFAPGNGIDFMITALSEQNPAAGVGSDYWIGAGANFELGSFATATAAIGTGEGDTGHSYFSADYISGAAIGNEQDYTNGSVGLTFSLSDVTSLEVGYSLTDVDNAGSVDTISGALFWSPVSQLKLGAGVGYATFDADAAGVSNVNATVAGLGAWFKF